MLGLFAATALLLAVIGLYGVMAYSVAQRTQEIGIRRALGAGHREVLWMVVGQGLRVTLIGIVCGVAAAYACTRLLESLLFEVSTTDAATFVVVPAVFVARRPAGEPDSCARGQYESIQSAPCVCNTGAPVPCVRDDSRRR